MQRQIKDYLTIRKEYSMNSLSGEVIVAKFKMAKTQEECNKLQMELFTFIYLNLERLGIYIRDEDERNDFLMEFYKTIPKMFATYNPALSSFTTYLITKLKYGIISFRGKLAKSMLKEEVVTGEEANRICTTIEDLENEGAYNFYVGDSEISYKKDADTKNVNTVFTWPSYFDMPIKHRRIFLLACKSCLFLDDKMIEKIAKELNMPVQVLFNVIHTLRESCKHRSDSIDALICKRNKYYINKKIYKTLLEANKQANASYSKEEKSYSINARLFYKTKEANRRQIKSPSSETIGKYLHIHRGTVDKNISDTFKKWYTQPDNKQFRTAI